MKKIAVFLLCAAAVLCLASCSRRSFANENAAKQTDNSAETFRKGFENVTAPPIDGDADEPESTADAKAEKDAERKQAAIESARRFLGEADAESGLKYTFSFDGMTDDAVRIRVSVRDGEGTSTLCGYLSVDNGGNVTKSEWD